MKRFLSLMAYITIILQIINIQIPFFNSVVFGYTVKYLIYYSFIALALTAWIGKMILKRCVSIIDFLLLLFIIFPFVIGLIFGWSGEHIVIDAVLFLMPVAVYAWCEICAPKMEGFFKVFCWTIIAAAVIAILVAVRIINTNIWAAEGTLVRSAGAVDSTIFIGGIILLSIKLFVYPDIGETKASLKLLYYVSWIGCIVGTFFCQSRTRLVIMLGVVVVCMLYNFFNHKSRYGNLRLILIGCAFAGIIVIMFPEITNQIFDQAISRFIGVTSGEDINVVSRNVEIDTQLKEFLTSPIIGKGFGIRSSSNRMYVHNIYTSLLMVGGTVFSLCYLLWMFEPVKVSLTDIRRNGANEYNISCLLLMFTLLILGYTNAGILQSGGYMSAIYAFIYTKMQPNNRRD